MNSPFFLTSAGTSENEYHPDHHSVDFDTDLGCRSLDLVALFGVTYRPLSHWYLLMPFAL